jgi:hypothetical protein
MLEKAIHILLMVAGNGMTLFRVNCIIGSALVLAILNYNIVCAQDSVIHLDLKDGRWAKGYLLFLDDSSVTIQQNIAGFEDRLNSLEDSLSVLQHANKIAFSNIARCEIERSSSLPLLGWPGIPLLLSSASLISSASNGSWVGPELEVIIMFGIGSVIGIPVALVLHNIYSQDLVINVSDPDDIETLREYALFPAGPPVNKAHP